MLKSVINTALVFRGAWDVGLEKVETRVDDLKPNEVVVEIKAATVCGTDIGILAGKYPARPGVVLGHESAGLIADIGSNNSGFCVGDRVAIDPTFFCGICHTCRKGFPNHCEMKAETETGVSKDGTFTRFYRTDSRFLRALPEHISYEAACLTEPTSCVLNAVRQLRLRSNLATVVVGGGPIGMLFCHILSIHGVCGVVIEISDSRRAQCQRLLPNGWRVASNWNSMLENNSRDRKFDLIVDACGAISSEMIDHVHRGGQVLIAGLRSGSLTIDPMKLADRSLSLLGSIDSNGTFDEALSLIATQRIPSEQFITRTFPLSTYKAAFAALGVDLENKRMTPQATGMKVVIYPE